MTRFLLALILTLFAVSAQAQDDDGRLQVGITLHPYYSFVANIVGDRADVVPLIPADMNPHGYQPQPADMQRAMEMDAIVVNGVGHDEWAFEILQAAGRGEDLPMIYANASVALIPVAGDREANVVNPHTFVSTNAAVQQVYEIARSLAELDPENGQYYLTNAREYAARIRRLRAEYAQQIGELDTSDFRAATMHAGYDYLFQEFGLGIDAVIEPRHGVNPTARQLAQTLDEIRAADVNALFAERYFASDLAATIREETGLEVFAISHITGGEYTADKFENEMRENIETLVAAIRSTAQ